VLRRSFSFPLGRHDFVGRRPETNRNFRTSPPSHDHLDSDGTPAGCASRHVHPALFNNSLVALMSSVAGVHAADLRPPVVRVAAIGS